MIPDLDHRLDLAGQVLYLLREHPEGLFRYQLIQLLKARRSMYIPHRKLANRLVLFRTHFLLFNVFYRLRDHLWAEHEAHLGISPLSLYLHPHVNDMQALERGGPLRGCYLDPRHLEETSEVNVERLLQSLWTRTQGNEGRTAAPALFELEGAVNYPAIELRYRRLINQHHPDRGDSTTYLQSISKVMKMLQRCYSRS